VNNAARATLLLRRSARTVARKRNQALSAGNARIRLNVPRKARGGRYSVRLTVTAGTTTRTFSRKVKIRSLRSRG
jgi:hypothetical protein